MKEDERITTGNSVRRRARMAGHRLRSVLPSAGSSASCSSGVRSSRNATAVATSAMGVTGAGYTVVGRAGRMRHPSSCECEACSRKARRFSLADTLAARGVPGASRGRGMVSSLRRSYNSYG